MKNSITLRGPVALSHTFMRNFIKAGDLVVDATCGNGNDTLLLAELVGESGRVHAFDIQQNALESTRSLLEQKGLSSRVQLIQSGHEHLAIHLKEPVTAIIFNLGYLPGGDHKVTTSAVTTIMALDQSARLLQPGGIIATTLYPGHDSGAAEAHAVREWSALLTPQSFFVWTMGQLNVPATAPYFILIQKAP